LPLDKKIDLLKKYNPLEQYQEGRYIDALDTVSSWCLAEIIEVDHKTLSLHFDGWSTKWDCVRIFNFKFIKLVLQNDFI